MAIAHVYFGKPVNSDTMTALTMGTRTLMGETDKNSGKVLWDRLHISIASGGGDVIPAFAAFNELNGLPLKVTTHNSGAVDSAAIVVFMAGERRTASEASSFFFHQLNWTFAAPSLVATVIADATKWLGRYEGMMADIVAKRSRLQRDDVLRMIREGTVVTPQDAKSMGLIHDIVECSIPQDARSWQV